MGHPTEKYSSYFFRWFATAVVLFITLVLAQVLGRNILNDGAEAMLGILAIFIALGGAISLLICIIAAIWEQ
jgi:hypothetical protein